MAFGLSAGAISLIGAAAPAVIGGLMGGQESGSQQTQKQELDPRMQALLYGSGGNPGLLGDTDNLRRQQLAQGGLNDLQRSGLEMQRQTLMSPQYTQGFDMMRNQGASLMGAGVAGNPFANGGGGRIPMGQASPAMQAPQGMASMYGNQQQGQMPQRDSGRAASGESVMQAPQSLAALYQQYQNAPMGQDQPGATGDSPMHALQSLAAMYGQQGQQGQDFRYDQSALQAAHTPIGAYQPAPMQSSPLDDYLKQLKNDNQAWQRTDASSGMGTRDYGGGR